MTRAVRIHEPGGPEVLRFEAVELPQPGPREVRVIQRAVGVNFIDTYHRSGLYSLPELPHGIGMEAAGIVDAVGAEVTEVRPGDRVAYATGAPGAYAEARVVAVRHLIPIPPGVDDETAAASLLKGMTVEYLVCRTRPVKAGETVLWQAVAGGVGLLACQWLRQLGATVIGTVGNDDKAELAKSRGCHHTVVYTRESVVERVRELTGGRGVPVVFDGVGQATFDASLDCLSPRGMLVSFGNASGKPAPFDLQALSQRGSLYVTRPTLMTYVATRQELLASADAVFARLLEGSLDVLVQQRFALAQAAEAHRALEQRQTTGSTLLLP